MKPLDLFALALQLMAAQLVWIEAAFLAALVGLPSALSSGPVFMSGWLVALSVDVLRLRRVQALEDHL